MAPEKKNPRYLAILTAASLVILIAGALFRPDRGAGGEENAAMAVPSPNEIARLQSLTQRRSVEAVARAFADLAAQVEPRILRLDHAGRTALMWTPERALTAGAAPFEARLTARAGGSSWTAAPALASPLSPLALVEIRGEGPPQPVQRFPAASYPAGEWAVVLWRTPSNGVDYRTGQLLGVSPVTCGRSKADALQLSIELNPSMLGAGVFDLDEGLFGVVADCDGEPTALSAESAESLIAAMDSLEHRLASRFGLRGTFVRGEQAERFGAAKGVLLREVWRGSPAYRAGLRPGDVVTAVAGAPPENVSALNAISPRAEALSLEVMRWGRVREVDLRLAPPEKTADSSPAGLRWPERKEGVKIEAVEPGSPLDAAGVRPHDRLLAINGRAVENREQAIEAAASFLEEPAYWMLERHGRLWGVWLRKSPPPKPPAPKATEAKAPKADDI